MFTGVSVFFSAKLLPYRNKQGKAQNYRVFITILNMYTERLTYFSSIIRLSCCVAIVLVYGTLLKQFCWVPDYSEQGFTVCKIKLPKNPSHINSSPKPLPFKKQITAENKVQTVGKTQIV